MTEDRAGRDWLESHFKALLVACIGLGVVVRAFHVFSSGFPLNDGGLFYAMTRDLQEAHYRLPELTSYNQAGIPFSYPPLGFYASGLIADLTPLSLLDTFRLLPLLATSLSIPAFYLLARSLLPSRMAVLGAVFAFALIPRTFIWLLMGGGVTRSLGFLFAILALYSLRLAFANGRRKHVAACILFASLTLLSHLETAWFLAFSSVIFFLAFGRSRRASADLALIGFGVLVLTAPWWGTVISDHGLAPFVAAQGTGGSVLADALSRREAVLGLTRMVATSEMLFPVLGCLGILGGVLLAARGHYLLPLWWAAIIILDLRAFPTFTTLPVAMMAGVGLAEGMLPLLQRQAAGRAAGEGGHAVSHGPGSVGRSGRGLALAPFAVLGALVLYASISALLRGGDLGGEVALLVSLSPDERSAMKWVDRQLPQDSRFLVIPDSGWEAAKTSEWFPLLARRQSVATVQGSEWLESGAFERRVEAFENAFECGFRTSSCLDRWRSETSLSYTHVYVAKPPQGQCCFTLVSSLVQDPRYHLVYDGPGATIFSFEAGDHPPIGGGESVSGQKRLE